MARPSSTKISPGRETQASCRPARRPGPRLPSAAASGDHVEDLEGLDSRGRWAPRLGSSTARDHRGPAHVLLRDLGQRQADDLALHAGGPGLTSSVAARFAAPRPPGWCPCARRFQSPSEAGPVDVDMVDVAAATGRDTRSRIPAPPRRPSACRGCREGRRKTVGPPTLSRWTA